MPTRRLIVPAVRTPSHYHCISRVVDRRFVFATRERDVFRKILRQVEAFCGVRVLTWTILSNHFHVLLEVPPPPSTPLSDQEILDRCRDLYPPHAMREIEWEFENARPLAGSAHQRLREKYLSRMWDLSEVMKTLKQKFTLWFNRTHGRAGTLWESRFRSVLVEGSWNSLMKVAAYVDLNAVRAGIVEDPIDYRWCGYAEAVAGDRRARRGLAIAMEETNTKPTWAETGRRYRKLLYGIGGEHPPRPGLSRKAIAAVWQAGGKLDLAQLLRCRVRYFSAGLALGSAEFVNGIFKRFPELFGNDRKTTARKLGRGEWDGMHSARALRIRPIDPGGDG